MKVLELSKRLPIYHKLREAYRWLHDPSIYEECFTKSAGPIISEAKVRLPAADIDIWIKHNKVSEFKGPPRGFVHLFYVIELMKLRRRGICEPWINAIISHAMLQGIKLPTRAEIRKFLFGHNSATTLDAAAFYDQFQLSESVRAFFVFEYNGKQYALNVLPMGFRPAADIAHLTAQALLDITQQQYSRAYIDNFIFTGPNQAQDVQRFLSACKDVNLILNELDDYTWHEKLSSVKFDFIGESYDLSGSGTKKSTDKTLAKLKLAAQAVHRTDLTAKEVAAIFGIAIYASSTCDVSLAEVFTPMRYLSHLGLTTVDWSAPALPIDLNTRKNLAEWLNILINTTPRPIYSPTPTSHDVEIQVDASCYGWGAVVITADSVKYHSRKWPSNFDASQSVTSEPMGAWLSVCAAVNKSTKKVLLRTDHAGLVFAIKNGHSMVQSYNDFIVNTRNVFPTCTIVAEHIAGVDNWMADGLSRQKEERELERKG